MTTYSLNKYGLRQKDMEYILALFKTIPAIEKAILYGSRAKGGFQQGSDVDLAIAGNKLTPQDIAHIRSKLEDESPAVLGYDVLHYDTVKNQALKAEIDSYGAVIYNR